MLNITSKFEEIIVEETVVREGWSGWWLSLDAGSTNWVDADAALPDKAVLKADLPLWRIHDATEYGNENMYIS